MKENIIMVMAGLVLFSGCAKLAHLDQLLTLKELSEEGDALQKHVEEHDKKFDLMLAEVKADTLKTYPDEKSFLAAFGEPVYKKTERKDGQDGEVWLYRQAKHTPDAEKVYVYFNASGNLREWRHVPSNSR
ncbi:MAG TPA: hypothetical protein DD723_04880 [Candidatus Omnitrophica bacterium]|nr:MAG: hypothetical protein A2Z81_05010 [Omnitrophica WOR_2 bacterium GWA2_45_18]HBR14864.1 hypothetical protein [Candidatus Omnitrophota bacterium]